MKYNPMATGALIVINILKIPMNIKFDLVIFASPTVLKYFIYGSKLGLSDTSIYIAGIMKYLSGTLRLDIHGIITVPTFAGMFIMTKYSDDITGSCRRLTKHPSMPFVLCL